tara:strand:- start:918 stop:1925 length:1008 start_codon:yes stop_codon:yes gene_type:complete
MQNPMVSILIPFKNTAQFLHECLGSILHQDYQNWEVLAVNDHSTDDSYALVANYAKNDSRIKIFDNKGTGIIQALQTAFSKITGQYITRMDSDDIMAKHRLALMVSALVESGPGHLAVGQVKYFSDRGISNGYERYETWLNNLTYHGINYSEIFKECVIPSPCWMVHRSDLEACGAFEPNRYPEDYDLAFRFYEAGLKCLPSNQILHHWRDYDSRTSRTSEHYAQNYFLEIKLHYFLKLEYDPSRPLVLWGAGNKGKEIAKGLLDKNTDFHWLCDNPNKIGKHIYGKEMFHFSTLNALQNSQSIITVANEEAQTTIRNYFGSLGQTAMKDYFFFC